MPIQSPLKNVKVGPFVAPKRTLMDVPEGVLTITNFTGGRALNSDSLLIRKRAGSRSVSSSGIDWGNASDFCLPDTLPEGLSAPGNALPSKSVTWADIPDYRVFMANSVRNADCRALWFKVGSVVYFYDRLKKYTSPLPNYGDCPSAIDTDLEKQYDFWGPADNAPGQIFFVTDWVVQVA